MADEAPSTATTEVPKSEGGFPPFDTTTFPSQLFWLVVTFAFLFTVLWRVAGPRINGAITLRRGTINSAIAAANKARGDAEGAEGAYRTALAAARARANALAEENRQGINAEIAKAKADADAQAAAAMAAAETRIAGSREAAKAQVTNAARDAAIAIVARLTGDTISPEDAAKAVGELSMELLHEILHEGETWVAVGFVLVIALLLWKGVPAMVGKMLDARAAGIAAELDEARRLSAEAAALLADYQARAAGAEAEAQSIIADARAEAARFAEESRAALTAQIARRAAGAQDKIAQAEAAALNEIRSLAADAAVSAAQKLIAARLDENRASALVAGAIKDLGDKLN